MDLFYSINFIHDKFSSLQKQIKEHEILIEGDEQVKRNLLRLSKWTNNDLNFLNNTIIH